jgi:hypothetical protein
MGDSSELLMRDLERLQYDGSERQKAESFQRETERIKRQKEAEKADEITFKYNDIIQKYSPVEECIKNGADEYINLSKLINNRQRRFPKKQGEEVRLSRSRDLLEFSLEEKINKKINYLLYESCNIKKMIENLTTLLEKSSPAVKTNNLPPGTSLNYKGQGNVSLGGRPKNKTRKSRK